MDNTVILYTGDQGFMLGEHDYMDKRWMYEDLKARLAKLRQRVGDTGEDFPAVEAILQDFWDYDEEDRRKAAEISHDVFQSKRTLRTKDRG